MKKKNKKKLDIEYINYNYLLFQNENIILKKN